MRGKNDRNRFLGLHSNRLCSTCLVDLAMTWQTDYVAMKLSNWIIHEVAENTTTSNSVSVHLDPETARHIVETVIWEYEQCAIKSGNGSPLLVGPVRAQQFSSSSCLHSPTDSVEIGGSDETRNS